MFFVQFKVDKLKSNLANVNSKIYLYEERIQLLEVEWTYLTRPERIRNLANLYLKNNQNLMVQQVKNINQIAQYNQKISPTTFASFVNEESQKKNQKIN